MEQPAAGQQRGQQQHATRTSEHEFCFVGDQREAPTNKATTQRFNRGSTFQQLNISTREPENLDELAQYSLRPKKSIPRYEYGQAYVLQPEINFFWDGASTTVQAAARCCAELTAPCPSCPRFHSFAGSPLPVLHARQLLHVNPMNI